MFSKIGYKWLLFGVSLIILSVFIFQISPNFDYDKTCQKKDILLVTITLFLMGVIFFIAFFNLKKVISNKNWFLWMFLVGGIIRVFFFFSTPIMEDDFYRYIWEGGLLANGESPYVYSPEDVMEGKVVPEKIQKLGEESGDIIKRINHPHLKTVYPTGAQVIFSLGWFITPWSEWGLRVVFLGFDLLTLFLLFRILISLSISPIYLLLYWWNPLLVKEIFNSIHMDIAIFPFILAAINLAINQKPFKSSGFLALAAGVKLWPVVLLPILLRPFFKKPKILLGILGVFIFITALFSLPTILGGLGQESGFTAYGERWEMNDALFMVFLWLPKQLGDFSSRELNLISRGIAGGIFLIWVLWVIQKDLVRKEDWWKKSLLLIAGLFFISPTQFPWYYTWVIPFLVICPHPSLLLMIVMLPLYYLRFYFKKTGNVDFFDYGVVWIEFIPVWIWILWEWYHSRKQVCEK